MHTKLLSILLLCSACLMTLGACTQTVKPEARIVPQPYAVAVPVKAPAPATLMVAFKVSLADMPIFLSPGDKTATSCLAPDGEHKLRNLMDGMLTRDQAWRAWAGTPLPLPATVTPPASATVDIPSASTRP